MKEPRQIVKVLLIGVVLYFCVVLGQSLMELYQARGRLSDAEIVLEEAKKENLELQKKLQEVSTDEYREKEVRDKLNLQLPGETVVIVPEQALQQREEVEEKERELANWQKWIELFRG